MTIDERITNIMTKMEKLSTKHPKFTCGKFPPRWNAPLKEEVVEKYEKDNKIELPKDYRRFITTVAGSGSQPFYGLNTIVNDTSQDEQINAVNKKFPYTVRTPLNIAELSAEEYEALFKDSVADAGYVVLCHEGCCMYSILIVNTDDADTYGTVWYYDLANDAGIWPLINPVTKKTMDFLDWLEYYVDRTLELDDSDYFSYGELAVIVE